MFKSAQLFIKRVTETRGLMSIAALFFLLTVCRSEPLRCSAQQAGDKTHPEGTAPRQVSKSPLPNKKEHATPFSQCCFEIMTSIQNGEFSCEYSSQRNTDSSKKEDAALWKSLSGCFLVFMLISQIVIQKEFRVSFELFSNVCYKCGTHAFCHVKKPQGLLLKC